MTEVHLFVLPVLRKVQLTPALGINSHQCQEGSVIFPLMRVQLQAQNQIQQLETVKKVFLTSCKKHYWSLEW